MRAMFIALPALVAAAPALAASPRSFENLDRLDSLVAMSVGANIGQPGGALAPVDRRLKLAACPATPVVEGPTLNSAVIKCEAIGWRIRVPLATGGAYAALQQDGLPLAVPPTAAPGRPVSPTSTFVRPAPTPPVAARVAIIKKGDPVVLVAGTSSFSVSRMMVADEDGAVGETIRLRGPERNAQTVVGRIESNGVVRVPGFQ